MRPAMSDILIKRVKRVTSRSFEPTPAEGAEARRRGQVQALGAIVVDVGLSRRPISLAIVSIAARTKNYDVAEKAAEQAAGTVLKGPVRVETLAVSSSDARCGRAAPRGPPAAALTDEAWGLARRRRLPSRRPAVWAGRAWAPPTPVSAPREVVALKPERTAKRIACYRSTSSFPSLG